MNITVLSVVGKPTIRLAADATPRTIAGEILIRYGAQVSPDGQSCIPHSWYAIKI